MQEHRSRCSRFSLRQAVSTSHAPFPRLGYVDASELCVAFRHLDIRVRLESGGTAMNFVNALLNRAFLKSFAFPFPSTRTRPQDACTLRARFFSSRAA
jgi:hypothetical protein